jgi:hypothetical protein
MESIILNSNISLEEIKNKLYRLQSKQELSGIIVEPILDSSGWGYKSVNRHLAFTDFRQSLRVMDNKDYHYMFYSANSFGANPNVVVIGIKEARRLILLKEVYTDLYDNPKVIEQGLIDIPLSSAYNNSLIDMEKIEDDKENLKQKKLELIRSSISVYQKIL